MSRCRRRCARRWPTSFLVPYTFDYWGKAGAANAIVWDLARQHRCLVVSKDEDFHRLSLLRGAPPKFIWIRLGNCTTADIAQLLRRRHDDIIRFNEQNEATVLELG